MIKAEFNRLMNFNIKDNKVTMELDDGLKGYEFETVIHDLKENEITHTINYIRDIKKNRTYSHSKFTKRYSSWVASIVFNLQKEGILKLQ